MSQKHHCPACNSPNTYFRVTLGTYICRQCSTTFYYGNGSRRYVEEYGSAREKRIKSITDV